MFEFGEVFEFFEKSLLCLLRLRLFDQIYSKNSNIVHVFI